MSKKTVALLGNSDLVIYNFRRELVERLVEEGHRVILLIPQVVHREYFESLHCKIYETPIDRRGTNPIKDYHLFRMYHSILKEERPDMVYTYTIKCSVYGGLAARLLRIPQIANVTGLGSAIKGGGLLKLVSVSLYRMGVKKAVCTFYQNQENMELCLKNKIVGKKYRLIPGSGVNLEQFLRMPYPEEKITHFYYIARVMKEKGIDEYLEAAKAVHEKHPDTCFHILGFCEEDYLKTLQELENEGIVKYHGMQEDILSFQQLNHCTVLPSYHEGMSNVCLESAACGRPVITSRIPGCQETVEDGQTGFLCEAQSAQSLIEAIEKFLLLSNEERAEMGKKGRLKMEKEFDRQHVVDAYMEESRQYL